MKATTNNNKQHFVTKSLWMFVVLCIFLVTTAYSETKDNPQEGIEFSKVFKKYDNGIVRFGVLAKDTAIIVGSNTYTFATVKHNYIYFYKSGKVKGGYLAKETAIIMGSNTYPFCYW